MKTISWSELLLELHAWLAGHHQAHLQETGQHLQETGQHCQGFYVKHIAVQSLLPSFYSRTHAVFFVNWPPPWTAVTGTGHILLEWNGMGSCTTFAQMVAARTLSSSIQSIRQAAAMHGDS
jgi:hypothetical protein